MTNIKSHYSLYIFMVIQKGILVLVLILGSLCMNAQEELGNSKNKGIIYLKETCGHFTAHTNGFSFGYSSGKLKTYMRTQYWRVELGHIQHPKAHRQSNNLQIPGARRSFIYGKQNSLYTLRLTWGQKRFLSEKQADKGVAVGWVYELGAMLGILKPYYLEVIQRNDLGQDVISEIKYSPENANLFLGNSIFGGSGLFKGLGESSLVPGGHAKLGVHFDWGAFEKYAKSLEAGIMLDLFPKKMPIMVEDGFDNVQNQAFLLNLYVTLQFGKRK